MSWLKDNKFLVTLGSATLAGAVLLFLAGSKGAAKYEAAKVDFESAAQEASNFERLPLYPKRENLDAKKKALDDYRKEAESLQAAFAKFRPADIKNVSPEDFTNRLKVSNGKIRKAFDEAGTTLPDAFFCGFENYKTNLAPGNATGILGYQLSGIESLMLALAQSGASELKNLHRPSLPEEQGQPFTPDPSAIARPLPIEITFLAPEGSARAFLSTLAKADGHYFVIRSLRFSNVKQDPPRAADAKFDKPAAAAAPAPTASSGGFVLPGDEPKPAEAKPAAPAATDASRILAQVLGNEELLVFLRLDLMQFLPAKKLP